MGLFSGMLGNAAEIDIDEIQEELAPVLATDENVTNAYKLIRDMIIFTSNRLILIDKQGMTGKKVEYHSIPFKAITQFKVETAGHFDMESELKIYVSGQADPMEITMTPDCAIGVQQSLANNMFK
jgi:hypothetical protein